MIAWIAPTARRGRATPALSTAMTSNSERKALPLSMGSVLADNTLPRTPTSEAAPLATQTNRSWKNPPRSALVSEPTSPVPPTPVKTPPIVWDSAPTVPSIDRRIPASPLLPPLVPLAP